MVAFRSLKEFLEATQKHYQADLKAVDFIGAPEACRGEINSWVEQQTESGYFLHKFTHPNQP